MNKRRYILLIAIGMLLIMMIAATKSYLREGEMNEMQEEIKIENKTVSMFSWYFELTNQGVFCQLAKPLKELGVTRVYQLVPVEYLTEPQMSVMVQNLCEMGIETVLLTGDKNWVVDGLDEYREIINGLSAYNESVLDELKITSVALDVEVHTLEGWQDNPKELFEKYVELMKQAKEYANAHGLKIIQIVPTCYDDVDKKLFAEFLLNGCDELSIMNYNKNTLFSAISTEVKLCEKYGIPVETIFETMPISEEHAVNEQITYYYDGIDVLKEDVAKMKEKYGPRLGIGYHHFSTLYKMCTGNYLAEIYPYGSVEKYQLTDMGQPRNPGTLLLVGDDGSRVVASPYWPNAKNGVGEYCWLAVGVQKDVQYTIQQFDLFETQTQNEILYFQDHEDEIKLKTTITLD